MLKFKFGAPIHTYHVLVIKPEWHNKLFELKINDLTRSDGLIELFDLLQITNTK